MGAKTEKTGFIISGIPYVTPREAYELCSQGAMMVDLRSEYLRAYKAFKISNVYYAPLDKIVELLSTYPKETLFICSETSTSEKSKIIVKEMQAIGYENIFILAGGFIEWERDGFPIVEDKNHRLTGSCMCQLKPRKRNL